MKRKFTKEQEHPLGTRRISENGKPEIYVKAGEDIIVKEMKPSTLAFALNRCRENGERMEREKQGDNGPCIYITA